MTKINKLLICSFTGILFSCGNNQKNNETSSLDAQGTPIHNRTLSNGSLSTVSVLSEVGTEHCTGVLISPTKVLTAAHCDIGEVFGKRIVSFGTHAREGNQIKGVFEKHPEHKKAIGFSFDGDTTLAELNDLAVITLERPVPSTWNVKPAKINFSGINYRDLVSLNGFGSGLAIEGSQTTDRHDRDFHRGIIMKSIEGTIRGRPRLGTPLNYSENDNPRYFLYSQNMFSVQYRKKNGIQSFTCDGDSGAGVFNNSGELVGIHTAGSDKVIYVEVDGVLKKKRVPNCEEGYGYAVDLSRYQEWIETGIHNEAPIPSEISSVHPKNIVEGSRDSNFISSEIIIRNHNLPITELYIASDFAPNFGFNLAFDEKFERESAFKVTLRTCKIFVKFRVYGQGHRNEELNICNGDRIITINRR